MVVFLSGGLFAEAQPKGKGATVTVAGLIIPRDDGGMYVRNSEGQFEVEWTKATQVAREMNTRLFRGLREGVLRYPVQASKQVIEFPLPKGPITGIVTLRNDGRVAGALKVAKEENWIPEFGLRLRFGEPLVKGQLASATAPRFIGQWNPKAMASTVYAAKRGQGRGPDPATMDEKALVAMVPEQTPIECADPAAGAYLRGLKRNWKWSPQDPDKIISPIDGISYPNAKFPMDRKVSFLNYKGEEVERSYWQGPKAKGDLRGNQHPERYFFDGAVDKKKFDWLVRGQLPRLIEVYQKTGDEEIARRIVVILARFAEVYPHYLLSEGRGINNYYLSTGGPWLVDGKKSKLKHPYSWTAGRLYGPWLGEIRMVFLEAWGAVRQSKVVDQLSKERGMNVRELIDRDLVREMVDFVMDMPWEAQMANNLPSYFRQMAMAGKIIGEPEYVHTAYRYVKDLIPTYGKKGDEGSGFTFDLHHGEGPQGHFGVMGRTYWILQELEGYSDPKGYVGKTTGVRLENFSAERDLPLFKRMVDAPFANQMPNASITPLNDSIGYHGPGKIGSQMVAPPLTRSYPRLLPGLGHAVLGAGEGAQQTQVQLEFSEQGAGHPHADCLGITWFANGREASGDIGYQRNILRGWSACSLSHNTVVVDGRNQQLHRDAFGDVQFYVDSLPGFSAIQVDAPDAYADGILSRYRRTLVHVTTDPAKPYFIDVFEVHGGSKHDYAIHGNLEGRDRGSCSLDLQKMPGEHPLLPDGETWIEPSKKGGRFNVYGLFRNVSKAAIQPSAYVDFTDRKLDNGTRIHLPMNDGQLFLGETPGLRGAGHYNDKAVYDDWMPHFIVRRDGKAGLKSVFVAVYDMHSGKPAISAVKRIDTDPGRVALEIKAGARTDAFVLQLDERRKVEFGTVKTDARVALAQDITGKPLLWMIEGTVMTVGGETISARTAMFAAPVTAMSKTSFTVDTALNRESLGRWGVLVHDAAEGHTHAYPIAAVTGKEVRLRMPHGLKMADGRTTEVFSPWRTFKGGGQLRIPAAVSNRNYRPGAYPFPGPLARHARHVTTVQKPVLRLSVALKPGLKWAMTATHDKGKLTKTNGVELVPKAPANQLNHRIVKTWDGYLRVETDGVYKFTVTADHGATLKIGDEQLIDSRWLRRFRPFTGSIRLKPGLHRFHLQHHFLKARSEPYLQIRLNDEPLSEGMLWHK